jgi:hypothetical protein
MRRKTFVPLLFLCLVGFIPPLGAQRQRPEQTRKVLYISFADARQVVSTLAEILPEDLKGKTESEIAAAWPSWVARYDAEIRARLTQGDEDSLINFLLFGTSFTKQPRITLNQIQSMKNAAGSTTGSDGNALLDPTLRLISTRITDLVKASIAPRGNDRLLFARKLFMAKGFNLDAKAGQKQAEEYLGSSLTRVMNENSGYARALEAARLQGDPTEEFAERSRLFRVRGLASDTSLLPNFAIEESLKEIRAQGLLGPASLRRVAIIGPGLDFTDKQEGYDFYPQQTIQPFAIMDTALRLGLAKADTLQIVTFDLSPRVNGHLAEARERARRGQAYVVQLPRDEQGKWKPEAIRYWEHFGDQIGRPVEPVRIPSTAGQVKIRAVSIRPALVPRVTPVDTNIVLQRPDLPPAEKFDLIIATNILVYYDNFDQSLAMMNVERMLRPGGLLLSNNALLELPFFRVRSAGYSSVAYSDRPNDGDHIVWYKRAVD